MAAPTTFNGITQYIPGGISRVRAGASTPIGPTATGIVGIIGEADGGQPGVVYTIDDPALAKSTFRSGPLADAIRLAFNPTNDPRLSSGAFRVVAVKTNQSTQSSINLPGDGSVLTGTSTGASTAAVVEVTGGGLTPNAHIGR